jgi:tetratricopeptide (TPR) repeat protein
VGGVTFPPIPSAVAAAVLLTALLASWIQWQPVRSAEAAEGAAVLLAKHPQQAISLARAAVARDPLSLQARETLASIQQAGGERSAARATLTEAVRLQPANPQSWLALGRFDLGHSPRAAVQEFGAVIYLNPELVSAEALAGGNVEAVAVHNEYIQALREASAPRH